MKLSDVSIDEIVSALRYERDRRIKAPLEEQRKMTAAEETVCSVLAALESVLKRVEFMQ